MRCVQPGHHWVTNPITGHRTWMEFPCGHCVACLHNQQDSWSIRMMESAKHSRNHEFIYDTLTFSNANLPLARLSDSEDSGQILSSYPSEVADLLVRYSKIYLENVGESALAVPYVTRDIIRDWIRRGRELFVYEHGYRPDWKYVVFMEYGPKTSRPHFHLLFFNIGLGDYVRYFKKPWRRQYGFTKTHLLRNDVQKDRQCVARYVSKYCSKGCFESPLVFYGLAPRPFRSISHGIGEEYLDRSCFAPFRDGFASALKSLVSKPFYFEGIDYYSGQDYSDFSKFDAVYGFEFAQKWRSSDKRLDCLSFYVDEQGYKHALPRYYKQKLLRLDKPNYYACKIQDLLLARTEQYNKGKLFEFALRLGYHYARKEAPLFGFSDKQYDSLSRQFVSAQALEARSQAKGCFIKLKNHYSRPLRNKAYAFVS